MNLPEGYDTREEAVEAVAEALSKEFESIPKPRQKELAALAEELVEKGIKSEEKISRFFENRGIESLTEKEQTFFLLSLGNQK